MFTLISTETKPVTPELALQFRDMEASPTERDLDPRRVNHLKEKAIAGMLVSFNWATAQLGNRTLRMNGRHSSTMLTELNGEFPENAIAHIDAYKVDNEEGLALLFRQFDDRKSGRQPIDVSGAYQGLYEPLRGINKQLTKRGVEAVAWWRKQIEKAPAPSGDDVYSLMGETGLHDFLRWLPTIFNVKTKEMEVTAVVAAMYATYNASTTGAHEFWSAVARNGISYDDNAPATVLDEWLKKLATKVPANADLISTVGAAQYYQGCIYAWNAYRKNMSLHDIRHDTTKGYLKIIN